MKFFNIRGIFEILKSIGLSYQNISKEKCYAILIGEILSKQKLDSIKFGF